VEVLLEFDRPAPIYKDAVAKIRSLGLLGDKYIEISPGHPSKGLLPPNSVIAYTMPPADVSSLIAKLNKATENINKLTKIVYILLENNRKQIENLVKNLALLSKNLNDLINANRKNIDHTLIAIRELAANLNKEIPKLAENYNQLAKSLNEVISENKPLLKSTLENINKLSYTLNRELPLLVKNINKATITLRENKRYIKSLLKNLSEITEKINRGRGTLGKLINDKRLYRELTKATSTLGKAASVVSKTQLHISAWAQYEGTGDSKAGIDIILQPDRKKYYLLGLVGDSAGKVTKKIEYVNGQPTYITEKEFKPEITIQYARIFVDHWIHPGSSFVLRIGIKESTGGIGMDYVINRRLMLTSDIWDFGREDHPNEDLKPNTEIGLKYMLYGPFFVKAGGYDLLNEKYRTIFVGGGMSFTDNDLKYLMGGLKLGF
jgi:phospholipid/cholesterol/gamma-HCH transport system substrate-binding protein